MVVIDSISISTSFAKNLQDGIVRRAVNVGNYVRGKTVKTHKRDQDGNTYKRSNDI